MKLKIKRVLAFAMTLTMLLGCFVFSTAAVEDPGAGTGTLIASGSDTGANGASSDGISFSVYEDANGYCTMWFYKNDSTNGGWLRPLEQVATGTTNAFWTCSFETGYGDGYTNDNAGVKAWCQANVKKVVIHSGAISLADYVFKGYSLLEYVEVNTKNFSENSERPLFFSRNGLFDGCPLKAIYETGDAPVDGVANLSYFKYLGGAGAARDPFDGNNTAIKTVILGQEVKFSICNPFSDLKGLEKVIITATDPDKITNGIDFSQNPMNLPDNCIVECANQAVAEKFSNITYIDESRVKCSANAEGAPTDAPGAGTGEIKYYGKCTNKSQEWQQFFVVRDDNAGNVTMYIYGDGANKGWFRPLSNATHWGATNLGADGITWCKAKVTKVVLDAVTALAAESFKGYTALQYVEYDANDIDPTTFIQRGALFSGCTLKAIYPTGTTPVDGVADFTKVTKLGREYDEKPDGTNIEGPLSGISGIDTVLLGEQVEFACSSSFTGMTGLKTIKLAATDAAKITQTKLNASWHLNVPTGAMIECQNESVANKIATTVTYNADVVTYPGKYPMVSDDNNIQYTLSSDGYDWILTVGTTEENTTKEITSLSTAVAGYATLKTVVTKIVFDDSVELIGNGACKGWDALTEVVLPNGKITVNAKETFIDCSNLKSIHPAYIERIDGVADLSTVTEFAGGDGGGWTFQGTGLHVFVFGDTCFNSKFMFGGHGSIDKLVFKGTVYTGRTDIGFHDMEFEVEVWSEYIQLPALDYYSGTAWVGRVNVTKKVISSRYLGYEIKDNENGTHDITFIAVIGTKDFDGVGFDVETNVGDKSFSVSTRTVYSKLEGKGVNGAYSYEADFAGGYVYFITITDVPAGNIEFTVKPYVTNNGSAEKIYGTFGTVTVGGAN